MVLEEVGQARLKNGLPFFMRGDILPLWENHQNIRGGSYSIKVPSDNVKEVFTAQVIQAMLGTAFKEDGNVCMGLSMSPKKGTFNILKIWNANAEKFGRMVVLMCVAGLAGLVLLLGLAVFASAVRPAAPVTYNRCLIFCGGQ
jgi:hypothetical protein